MLYHVHLSENYVVWSSRLTQIWRTSRQRSWQSTLAQSRLLGKVSIQLQQLLIGKPAIWVAISSLLQWKWKRREVGPAIISACSSPYLNDHQLRCTTMNFPCRPAAHLQKEKGRAEFIFNHPTSLPSPLPSSLSIRVLCTKNPKSPLSFLTSLRSPGKVTCGVLLWHSWSYNSGPPSLACTAYSPTNMNKLPCLKACAYTENLEL